MHAKNFINPEDDESYSAFISPHDEMKLFAAQTALDAWLMLPAPDRVSRDLACENLFSAAFALLGSAEARAFLVDHGAQSALGADDAHSFARFVEMGASLRPAVLVQSAHSAYTDSWEGSLLNHCALKRRWHCAAYVASLPIARQDMELCESVLREPEPCALRDFTREKLMELDTQRLAKKGGDADSVRLALDAAGTANDLIFTLINAHSRQSETLSMSIAVSSVLRGNPFFIALRLVCDTERGGRPNGQRCVDTDGRTGVQALADLGLFNLDSACHREALLGLCAPDHHLACTMARALGLTPEMGSKAARDELLDSVAERVNLSAPRAFVDFLGAWAQGPDFPAKVWDRAGLVLDHALSGLARADDASGPKTWKVERATRALEGLIAAADRPETGLAFDATAARAVLRERLDGVLLDHGDKLVGKPCYEAVRELSRNLGGATLPRSRPKKV